jgi:hypothetical protein
MGNRSWNSGLFGWGNLLGMGGRGVGWSACVGSKVNGGL